MICGEYKDFRTASVRTKKRRINRISARLFDTTQNFTSNPSKEIISTEENEEQIASINIYTQHNLNSTRHNKTNKTKENIITKSTEELKIHLVNWTIENNIAHSSVNKLIKIMKNASLKEIKELPDDCRTLLNTPKRVFCEPCKPGLLYNIGFVVPLNHQLSGLDKNDIPTSLILDFNVDGLPISKSSNSQFWPILCKIRNLNFEPFVVSVYAGRRKPHDCSKYLEFFVHSLLDLIKESFTYKDNTISIVIGNFICDAPAKAYITEVKGHNAYFGCGKCTQEGEFFSTVCFTEIINSKRTDASFRNQLNMEHHKGSSMLLKLPINMIEQFPLDYMHLVCLGVVKKFVAILIKGELKTRLPSASISKINEKLTNIAESQPNEFQRCIRTFDVFAFWKATEFRTFLLYTGPIVLKDVIPDELYLHFLLLHCAIRILISQDLYLTKNKCAEKLLQLYVEQFSQYYGSKLISYNVHNLLHLAEDSLRNGNLDKFSAFPYETFLGKLKRLLHTGSKALPQVANRLQEKYHNLKPKHCSNYLKIPQVTKIITSNDKNIQYSEIKYKNFLLNTSNKNKWFISTNGQIAEFKYVKLINNEFIITGKVIKNKRAYFTYPMSSCHLNIYEADAETSSETLFKIAEVFQKMFAILQSNTYIFMPLCH